MRNKLVLLSLLMCSLAPASAQQVSIGIWTPNLSIGINLPQYPEFVPVPGYPVYYAPRLNVNYFFYDGMYWVYQDDNWYASSWYNGPWGMVRPEFVPVYVLRVPVRYYRQPPPYFRSWQSDAPPRWHEHWGNEWAQRRSGWDRWDRSAAPPPAPLPFYQRQYSGERYPRVEQQHELQNQNYRYQPRDPVVREHYRAQQKQTAPAERETREMPSDRQRSAPPPPPSVQQDAPDFPRARPRQQRDRDVQREAPPQARPRQGGPAVQEQRQRPPQGADQHEQRQPRARSEETESQRQVSPQEPERGQGHGQGRGKDKDREKADDRDRGHRN